MFITFEGIDGCGKSTQLELLAKKLKQEGHEVLTLREPGATTLSEAIRELVLSVSQNINPVAELLLFGAARAQLVETIIRPALDEGKFVLCDRYIDSSTAYQGYGREISLEKVRQLNFLATSDLKPDITFYFDIPVEAARRRSEGRTLDRMEKSDDVFFEKVREGYLKLAADEPQRVVALDALLEPGEIHETLLHSLRGKFEKEKTVI